jgi:hypothetical protein
MLPGGIPGLTAKCRSGPRIVTGRFTSAVRRKNSARRSNGSNTVAMLGAIKSPAPTKHQYAGSSCTSTTTSSGGSGAHPTY